MSAEYETMATIRRVTDHDCGLYEVGEISGAFDPADLQKYLEVHGERGLSNLLLRLSGLQHQVWEAWRTMPRSEGCSAT